MENTTMDDAPYIRTSGPVHGWFELSYAHYLTVPRSIMQSMPVEWQERMVRCLEELDDALDWRPREACYYVTLNTLDLDPDENGYVKGREVDDPFHDYRHEYWTPEKIAALRRRP